MAQNWSNWCRQLGLGSSLAIGRAIARVVVLFPIAFFGDYALAQITPDSTLGAESSVVTPTNIKGLPTEQIDGGATRGANLFHSFEQFSVPPGGAAYFNNALDIQNIISRVTGRSISNIDGLIKVKGTANLFLLNPNGIIFGPNASLNIRGSFLGSTASSLNFFDGTQFSATAPQTAPLLTVSVPLGLQFGGAAGSIRVQGSGLGVDPGKTLALVGGEITLEGGERGASRIPNLAAPGGRIELGSVTGVGEASLNQRGDSWVLGYDSIDTFGNIRLEDKAFVNATGKGGGSIQIQGAELLLTQGSRIYADTSGTVAGGEVLVHTTKAVTLSEGSRITTDVLNAATGTGGNITIETGQLSIQGGSLVRPGALLGSNGQGGNLTVSASEIKLDGISSDGRSPSGLFTQTRGAGSAGNLTIATGRLSVWSGAKVSASSESSFSTANAGNLTVSASEIELVGGGTTIDGWSPSGLFTRTYGAGVAGDLTIQAGSITLDRGASLSAEAVNGSGGNMTIKAQDWLLMRHNSLISAEAYGNGGNITINAPLIFSVPTENIDIIANASRGRGGDITITTSGIYGLENRPQRTSLSDITASSDFGVNGTVQINRLDIDPSEGLVSLPTALVEASGLIATGCAALGDNIFIVTGRGGLPPNPSDTLSSDTVWTDLRLTTHEVENRPSSEEATQPTNSTAGQLVEAQGWVINNKGEIVLTASAPTVTPHSPGLRSLTCHTP